MSKIITKGLIIVLITVGVFVGIETTPAQEIPVFKKLSQVEQWKEYLKDELFEKEKTYQDFVIMEAIVFCESGWGQYYENGEVKVSKGNIGLAQINRLAHHEEYRQLGLDPYDPLNNLSYAAILYDKNGVRDWEKWSGACWKPILAEKGIVFNN